MPPQRALAVAAVLLVALVGAGPVGGVGTAAATTCSFPYTKTDATGATVTVNAPPTTVVSLGASTSQTLWEIDATDQVVGVSSHSTYLDGADQKTDVGVAYPGSYERAKIANLEPDLILVPNAASDQVVSTLRSDGHTVYKFREAASLADIYAKTRLTGRLVGKCAPADAKASEMERTVRKMDDALERVDRPRTYYSMGGGWTAGAGTYVDDALSHVGVENVASNDPSDPTGYYDMSDSVARAEDPVWAVSATGTASLPDEPGYQDTVAATRGNVVVPDSNDLSPAPRIVDAMKAVMEAVHPDAYAAAFGSGGSGTADAEPALDVTVEPSNATAAVGESVTVSVSVTNEGTAPGQYAAVLYVDGERRRSKDLYVPVGGRETATFETAFDVPGDHAVSIGDQQAVTVRVHEPDATATSASAPPSSTRTAETATSGTTVAETTAAHVTTTADATATTTRTTVETPESATATGGQPGFTGLAGLLALCVAALAARWATRP